MKTGSHNILIFTPTYNESRNIGDLLTQLLALELPADILVIDDHSPDGTAGIVSEMGRHHPNVHILCRAGKQGIGSAHIAALHHARAHGYGVLITMDADFSHKPTDIPRLFEHTDDFDIVVGSRYHSADSLREWNIGRKIITHFGHYLTKRLLGLPYDASGALRLYRIDRISPDLLAMIRARDYEFFFESLTVLNEAGLRIGEVPVALPARAHGCSKMRFHHMVRGVLRLFQLAATRRRVRAAR